MSAAMDIPRATVSREIRAEGIGIHSGETVRVRFLPAEPGTGIVFIHAARGRRSPIPARLEHVVETHFAVTLGNGEWKIMTIEHVLAVLSMRGVTDAYVESDAEEMPIFDGSAHTLARLFDEASVATLPGSIAPYVVTTPVNVVEGDKFIVALPSPTARLSYIIAYTHPVIQTQYADYPLEPSVFFSEIAPARTYGFEKDVQMLIASGLAKGGSLDNALVIGETGYINEPRFPDECVRHKALDFIGDLALIGRPVVGHFIACKAGHTLDVAFGRTFLAAYGG